MGLALLPAIALLWLSTGALAQTLSGRLEVLGPGAAQHRPVIEAQLSTVLTLAAAAAPVIVGPLGPVGPGAASPRSSANEPNVALAVRIQLVGHGRRARAIVDVSSGDGYPLLSRTVPGIGSSMGREVLAAAALDAVRDGAVSLVQHERSRAREESLRRARAAEESRREQQRAQREAAEDGHDDAVRLRASGGLALRIRTLDVVLAGRDELVYESGPFAELALLVEARPFAADGGWLRGFYAEIVGATALGLTALQQDGGSLDVGAARVLGSAGYRYAMGPVEVGGSMGFGLDVFSLDPESIVPSTTLAYFRIGPSARLELIRDGLLAAKVDVGLRLPLGAGELGDTFGPASAFGFDASAGLEGRMGRFVYGLNLGLSRYGFGWDEGASGGALASAEEATEAVDGSLWAMATAGYHVF